MLTSVVLSRKPTALCRLIVAHTDRLDFEVNRDPSEADRTLTRRLREANALMGIPDV